MKTYAGQTGIQALWGKVRALFGHDIQVTGTNTIQLLNAADTPTILGQAQLPYATATTGGIMTDAMAQKLDGVTAGAEPNQNAFSNVAVSGQTTVAADGKADTLTLAAGSNVAITTNANTDTVTIAATDTTYSDVVAGGASGLMTGADKTKLNGIATGAEVNQNAFSTVKVGSTDLVADAKSDTLTITAGANVTLTPTASSDSFSIAATDTTYSDFGGATSSAAGTHGLVPAPATSDSSAVLGGGGDWVGLALDGTATASSYSLDVATFDPSVAEQAREYAVVNGTGVTIPAATTSAAGVMSSSDKTKLNGIATGAEVNQNAFSNVKVGSTTVAADGKTDTLELVAGSNVTLTPDATNDKVTIAATDTTYGLSISGHTVSLVAGGGTSSVTVPDNDTTYSDFAGSTHGLVPQSSGASNEVLVSDGSWSTLTPSLTNGMIGIGIGDTTVVAQASMATTSAAGLMSASDKAKLDSLGLAANIPHATCPTAAGTAAKVATLDGSQGFTLAAGAVVAVTFTYGNSAATPTLNVNGTGAKNIAIPSSATAQTTGSGTTYNTWGAYETLLFTYSGSQWVHLGSGRLQYLAYNTAAAAAPKASPALTGTPTAPTAAEGTNTTQIATTAFVSTAVSTAIGGLGNVMEYKGQVATYSALPNNASTGDTYNVTADGHNYTWSGSDWDDLGGTVDLSAYQLASELVEMTAAEVEAICTI